MNNNHSVTLSIKVYRLLLWAYPRSFQRKFGDAMIGVFAENCRDVFVQTGTRGVLALWLSTVADLVRSATGERVSFFVASMKVPDINYRTKCLWLPGLVSLTAAMVWLTILTRVGPQPQFLMLGSMMGGVYFPWLALLPLCGACGAYLSRRAGGRRLACLSTGLFPSAVIFGLICLPMLASYLVSRKAYAMPQCSSFPMAVFGGAVLPAVALLLGALPFLKTLRKTISSRTGLFLPIT